jgi:hypothetical protein
MIYLNLSRANLDLLMIIALIGTRSFVRPYHCALTTTLWSHHRGYKINFILEQSTTFNSSTVLQFYMMTTSSPNNDMLKQFSGYALSPLHDGVLRSTC